MCQHRRCKHCGKTMEAGFCIGDNMAVEAYYCSEECLFAHYTEQEYLNMHEGDYAFWTQWDDEQEETV